MANHQVINFSFNAKALKQIEEHAKRAFLQQLELKVKIYLATTPDDDGDEYYVSNREHAERELNGFIKWVQDQVDNAA